MYYLLIIILISLAIMWYDISARRIPNIALGLLLVVGICFLLSSKHAATITGGISLPIVVFIVGFGLSAMNVIGMGDIKLICIALLLSPASVQVDMLYFVTFIGGVWGIIWHYLLRHVKFIKLIDKVGEGVPYGIPVALTLCLFTFVS